MSAGVKSGEGTGVADERELLRRTADELLSQHCPPEVVAAAEGSWAEPLWARLAETGLTSIGVPEAAGGSGGTLADAAVVVRVAATHAAPVPLAETLFPASAVCAAAGLAPPAGPVTVATGPSYRRVLGAVELDGTATRVPYARCAERVLVVAIPSDASGPELAAWVRPSALTLIEGDNLAGEPRDELTVSGVRPAEVAEVPDGTAEAVSRHGALARSLQLAGALSAVLDLTVRYANEREQFGRPIGRFQAVQHLIAQLAGTVVASEAAAHAAVLAVAAGAPGAGALEPAATLAVACAKSRASAAAGFGARIAHQVHGAIGFTQEHRLHHLTRRLWAWREEYGSDEHWSAVVGRSVIEAGADELWPSMTRV